ncbi:unnamed protein product [Caenorhabditis nigoni]
MGGPYLRHQRILGLLWHPDIWGYIMGIRRHGRTISLALENLAITLASGCLATPWAKRRGNGSGSEKNIAGQLHIVMCKTCEQWFLYFCLTLQNRTTDWDGRAFLCCGNLRDRRADVAKAGKVFRHYATLKKKS